jgi:hypothetical protein
MNQHCERLHTTEGTIFVGGGANSHLSLLPECGYFCKFSVCLLLSKSAVKKKLFLFETRLLHYASFWKNAA